MRTTRVTRAAIVLLLSVICLLQTRAAGSGLSPFLQELDPESIAIQAASKEIAPFVESQAPITYDTKSIFPTIPAPPGKPFSPATDPARLASLHPAIVEELASPLSTALPSGDYELQGTAFCAKLSGAEIGRPGLWLLAPLRGARAGILATIFANSFSGKVDFSELQSLSWSIEAGLRYDELSQNDQQLYDRLAPGLRSQIAEDVVDQVQDKWNELSSTIPDLPSLDDSLSRMGAIGQTILTMQQARETIINNADDFNALKSTFLTKGSLPQNYTGPTPWSIIVPNHLYARILTSGALGTPLTMQLRVIKSSQSAAVAATQKSAAYIVWYVAYASALAPTVSLALDNMVYEDTPPRSDASAIASAWDLYQPTAPAWGDPPAGGD